MNRIDEVFIKLRGERRSALIPFITLGDPDVDTSIEIIKHLELAGADIIELGVPYSDPLADGPVIQRASQRALKHGISILDCIGVASRARESGVTLPFILFTYYNPVLQLGLERVFGILADNGISGMIIPDLPYEEDEEVRKLSEAYNIHLIPLVAPTSNARIKQISAKAAGFVYCVSSLGVTGTRTQFYEGIDQFLQTVRESTMLPIAVGFGVSTNEHFRAFAQKSDGVIVGSAIVRTIEEVLPLLTNPATRTKGLTHIQKFVSDLKGN
jgi:tryptophan synthase alpha chain